MEKRAYLPSVTFIRGIAAFSVCLFHFTKGFISEISGPIQFAPYAWVGVEVFFVVSGFVIPYYLLDTKFKTKHYGGYLIKRIIRIEPAYLVSIALVIGLNYVSSLFTIYKGEPFSVSGNQLLLHLGYLIDFFDGTWLNPVYWTLAIEFQYYIVIGFLIILWNKNIRYLTILSVLLFLALSFIPQHDVKFFRHTDIFTIGIVCAFYKIGHLRKSYYLLAVIALGIIIYIHHNTVITVLSLIATLGIAFFNQKKKIAWLVFLGNISYSLYLTHVPIGGRVINLSKRFALNEFNKLLVILLAIVVSIVAAYIFYILIEKPSHRWSKSIKFRDSLNESEKVTGKTN
ncbi:acyltransferase [uncultured Psychroserpens sp.]|uniref:acyltransferase family protein n=1 Tax=uncultured Psychroserpens sp. TaxID=255436 RepID=UPI00262F7F7A|nr:acyltransferase [uncultured Psychroserpens sp.]